MQFVVLWRPERIVQPMVGLSSVAILAQVSFKQAIRFFVTRARQLVIVECDRRAPSKNHVADEIVHWWLEWPLPVYFSFIFHFFRHIIVSRN